MINWIIYPIISAFLWAIVNHMDKYLLSKYCKEREIGGLLIFSGIIALPVIIVLVILYPSVLTSLDFRSVVLVIVAGICYLLGLIPYLYALEEDETSTVAPQMILVTVFTLVLGYFFLGEHLTISQSIGSGMVVLGAILLSLDIEDILKAKFKTKIFGLMLIYSFLVSINVFLFKYVALDASFVATIFWLHVGYLIFTVFILIFVKNYRKQFFRLIKVNPTGIIAVNSLSEIISLVGDVLFHYSTLLIPIALAEVVAEGVQPFFVLILGIIITKSFPSIAEEKIGYKQILQKIGTIALMSAGIILIDLL